MLGNYIDAFYLYRRYLDRVKTDEEGGKNIIKFLDRYSLVHGFKLKR